MWNEGQATPPPNPRNTYAKIQSAKAAAKILTMMVYNASGFLQSKIKDTKLLMSASGQAMNEKRAEKTKKKPPKGNASRVSHPAPAISQPKAASARSP